MNVTSLAPSKVYPLRGFLHSITGGTPRISTKLKKMASQLRLTSLLTDNDILPLTTASVLEYHSHPDDN